MTASVKAVDAENLSLDVDGDRFVYRRFGATDEAVPPLVLLQHFRGNLDSWDPDLLDRLAQDRELVLLDNRGVGGSSGHAPPTVNAMALDAISFISALGVSEVDILGFSLGGHVAQEIALLKPRLVRRLVLAGTAPRGASKLHRWSDDVYALAAPDQPSAETLLALFFSPSEESYARGQEYLGRAYSRQENRDVDVDLKTRDAQLLALTEWGIPDSTMLERLSAITQPTLVANGDNDTMMHTANSYLLAERLPNAHLRTYPDAGHGFLDQYPTLFADHVIGFLTSHA